MLILVVALTCTSTISIQAQTETEKTSEVQKSETKITLILEIKGMTCQLGCADGLDNAFKDIKGIISSKTTFDNGSSEIIYDPRLISEKKIIKIIKKRGFTSTVLNKK